MKNTLSTMVMFVALSSFCNESFSQEKTKKKKEITAEDLNTSMMNEVDAYKAKWTFQCAKSNSNHGIGFFCGVEFARTVEKYEVKYKKVLRKKKEKEAQTIVKKKLINSHMDSKYSKSMWRAVHIRSKCRTKSKTSYQKMKACIKRNEPQEKMRKLYKEAKEKLLPLRIYSKSEIYKYKPKEISVVE